MWWQCLSLHLFIYPCRLLVAILLHYAPKTRIEIEIKIESNRMNATHSAEHLSSVRHSHCLVFTNLHTVNSFLFTLNHRRHTDSVLLASVCVRRSFSVCDFVIFFFGSPDDDVCFYSLSTDAKKKSYELFVFIIIICIAIRRSEWSSSSRFQPNVDASLF